MNLVGNAIKFTNQGFITVRAAIEEQGAEQPVVKISVIDTGIGIEEEVQANLFQSFTQGDGSYDAEVRRDRARTRRSPSNLSN